MRNEKPDKSLVHVWLEQEQADVPTGEPIPELDPQTPESESDPSGEDAQSIQRRDI